MYKHAHAHIHLQSRTQIANRLQGDLSLFNDSTALHLSSHLKSLEHLSLCHTAQSAHPLAPR